MLGVCQQNLNNIEVTKLLKSLFFLLLFFSVPIWSHSSAKLAQNESVFDEADLADIEADDFSEEDSVLTEEFGDLPSEEDSDVDNFDLEDFEVEEGEVSSNEDDSESTDDLADDTDSQDEMEDEGKINLEDYEILSDKPDYEVITDAELEIEFEQDEEKPKTESLIEDLEGESEEALDFSEEDDSQTSVDEDDFDESDEEITDDSIEDIEESEVPPLSDEIEIPIEEFNEEENTENKLQEIEEQEAEETAIFEDTTDFDDTEMNEDSITNEVSLNLVSNIRYLSEKDQVIISTSEVPSYEEKVNTETNQLIITIMQAKLAKNLQWPYPLRDFDTNFGLIKADQKTPDTVRVLIQFKEEASMPPITLTEEGITIGYENRTEDSPLKIGGTSKGKTSHDATKGIPLSKSLEDIYFGNVEFSGSTISFHVIDADVKQVLRFISEESGLNMVIDDQVQGTVNLKLEDIPWDQALFTIFDIKGLTYTRRGNVITILPIAKHKQNQDRLKEIAKDQMALIPFETKVIPVLHAKAEDVEKYLNSFLSSDPVKGKIIVHTESNALIVTHTAKKIEEVEALVKTFDKLPYQVMIESKIVEVSKSFSRNFGVNWNLNGDLPVRIEAGGFFRFFANAFNGLSLNWAAGSRGQGSMNLSGLPFIGDINASLNLAEKQGSARVLTTTKVVAKNGIAASISRNTTISILDSVNEGPQEGTSTLNTKTNYKSETVTIGTSVTPVVTSSGNISLKVNIDLGEPGPGGPGETSKINRNASTEVLAKNGQTVVLSGIYQKNESEGGEGFSFLRRIPILKYLFEDTAVLSSESEMLMFITPTLIED